MHILVLTGTIEFELIDDKNTKTIDEKTFMLQYYKDYDKFKKAYKDYQEELLKDQQQEKPDKKTDKFIKVDNKLIPTIELFDDKLNTIKNKNKRNRY